MAYVKKNHDTYNLAHNPINIFPNREGEYCGNYHPVFKILPRTGETVEQADFRNRVWLSFMRFGRPKSCVAGTTKELERRGFVGLYLRNTRPLLADELEVPTPENLKEPKAKVRLEATIKVVYDADPQDYMFSRGDKNLGDLILEFENNTILKSINELLK